MSEVTQTQTLEQTLNKTDLGHVIYEHRKTFIGLIIAVLVAVMGWIAWKESQESKALKDSVQVFEFQTKTWESARAGKISKPDLVKAFEGLDKNIQTSPLMIPVGLEMGKFLYDNGSYAEAEAILSKLDQSSLHPVSAFFIGFQRVAVLEKLNKVPEAIAVLEKLSTQKEALMAPRISVELGRLYMAQGEKGKAQSQFETVVNQYPNGEEAKLAKLYLAQLAK